MAETLRHLVDAHRGGMPLHHYAERVLGLGAKTLYRLMRGLTRRGPQPGTVSLLSRKLRISEARVRRAIAASRAAAESA